jgi:hypothetical protein
VAEQVLESYIYHSGPHNPQYSRDGAFLATDGPDCWSCYDAAAMLPRCGRGDVALRRVAIETFDRAIRIYEEPRGEFAPDAVTTGFLAVDLGISYLELRPFLPVAARKRWIASTGRAANWLINIGQTTSTYAEPRSYGWDGRLPAIPPLPRRVRARVGNSRSRRASGDGRRTASSSHVSRPCRMDRTAQGTWRNPRVAGAA